MSYKYILIVMLPKNKAVSELFFSPSDAFSKKEDIDIARRRKVNVVVNNISYKAVDLSVVGVFRLVRLRSEYSGI